MAAGGVQADQMPGGDEDRFDPGAGAQRPAHRPVPVDERGEGPALLAETFVAAGERRLGHPRRRQPAEHPRMAGEPEPSWVRRQVTVAEQQTGDGTELTQRLDQRGQLPEGEQSGDMGERAGADGRRRLDRQERARVHDDDGRRDTCPPPVAAVTRVRRIEPGDRARSLRAGPVWSARARIRSCTASAPGSSSGHG